MSVREFSNAEITTAEYMDLEQVLSPCLGDFVDICLGYPILCLVVRTFRNIYPHNYVQLNDYYIRLVRLMREAYVGVDAVIDSYYGSRGSADLEYFLVNPHVFEDEVYIPASTLFDIDIKLWPEIDHKFDMYTDLVERNYYEVIGREKLKAPHDELFQRIINNIEKLDPAVDRKILVLNTSNGTLTYRDVQPIRVSLGTNEIRLLGLLLENIGRVVSYNQIGEKLNLNCYDPSKPWDAAPHEVKQLKVRLCKILGLAGMTKENIASAFKVQSKTGYILTLK